MSEQDTDSVAALREMAPMLEELITLFKPEAKGTIAPGLEKIAAEIERLRADLARAHGTLDLLQAIQKSGKP